MKLLRYYVLVALVIILVYAGLAYRLNREVVAQHEQTFNQNQSLQTQLSARSIEDHFGWVMDGFYAAAAYGIPEDTPVVEPAMLSNVADLLATTLRIYPDETLLIGYFTSPGDLLLVFKSPSGLLDEAQQALDGWVEANWPLLEVHSGVVVTPFDATPDHQLYGVLLPVSRQGKFLGVLAGTMNFAPVLERYVSPMHSGHYGSAWVQDTHGLVVYDHETPIIGQNVFEMNRDYADLQRTFQRMADQDRGQDEYHFLTQRGGTVVRKLVAWDTVYLGDQRLTIALAAPSTEINSNLQGYRQFTLLLGLLLGITLVGSGSLFYLTRQRVLERRVAERTQELETLTTSLEQRIAERTQELELERAQLRTILEAMEDGVVYGERGVIRYVNPAMCRLTGYTLEDFVTHSREVYNALLSPNDPARVASLKRRFETNLGRGELRRETIRVQHRDGRLFDASITVAQVRNAQGEIVGRVDGLRDISHEKALQDQRDLFITNASHELRRPLTNLKARLYLLSRQPERMAEHLSVVQKAADDMADLVQDLVEVAQFSREDVRLDSKSLVVQHALEAALSIQEAPASRKQVTLLAAVPDLPIHVFGDYQRLVQTFGNLISSAVHFSPPGGRVQVRLFTRSNGHGSWAVIQVQGGGPGIPPDQLAFVFDPFFRASEGDASTTGLELTVARHVVELHRGLLTVESDAQEGNTFTLQLSTNLTPLPSER